MSDYISRADALVAVCKWCEHQYCESKEKCGQWIAMTILPSADAVSREDYEDIIKDYRKQYENMNNEIADLEIKLSADAVPKWDCTANFVAEQLDRLRKMTDEEKWNFFREFFGMGDAVQGEWTQISPAKIYECSVCHHNVLTDYIDTYNYCPSCGARMKGGND